MVSRSDLLEAEEVKTGYRAQRRGVTSNKQCFHDLWFIRKKGAIFVVGKYVGISKYIDFAT